MTYGIREDIVNKIEVCLSTVILVGNQWAKQVG